MNRKKPVSVEDLLQVKRAERPRAEFWADFERELRAKQLAAIVEPRPWWSPFIRMGARVSRHQLPVGAAAILALSFVTVREYRAPHAIHPELPEIAAMSVYREGQARASAPVLATPAPAAAQIDAEVSAAPTEAVAALDVGKVAHTVALLEEPAAAVLEPTPSARYIAANLAAAQADNPGLMDEVFGATARRADMREPVRDPLAQMAVPGESRRSRLLATALPAVAGAAEVEIVETERVSRHLTEDRLYDSISRIGVKGDRVAFKF